MMRNNYKYVRQLALDNDIDDLDSFVEYIRNKCKVDICKCIKYFKIKSSRK